VPETPVRLLYNEPTVMWRMRRTDGRLSHAVIGRVRTEPSSSGSSTAVRWGIEDFGDWTSALRWSDQMQAQNWAVGWRLAPES
jgi:hypothetical protein